MQQLSGCKATYLIVCCFQDGERRTAGGSCRVVMYWLATAAAAAGAAREQMAGCKLTGCSLHAHVRMTAARVHAECCSSCNAAPPGSCCIVRLASNALCMATALRAAAATSRSACRTSGAVGSAATETTVETHKPHAAQYSILSMLNAADCDGCHGLQEWDTRHIGQYTALPPADWLCPCWWQHWYTAPPSTPLHSTLRPSARTLLVLLHAHRRRHRLAEFTECTVNLETDRQPDRQTDRHGKAHNRTKLQLRPVRANPDASRRQELPKPLLSCSEPCRCAVVDRATSATNPALLFSTTRCIHTTQQSPCQCLCPTLHATCACCCHKKTQPTAHR